MASRIASLVPLGVAFFKSQPPDNRERTGLKRRVSLRESTARKLKEQSSRVVYERNGRIARVRLPKKISKARRNRMRQYMAEQEAFLRRPENLMCNICTVRREHGENILIHAATEIHHFAGRIGRLLCFVPYFRSSCRECRLWPHEHPQEARKLGLLAPAHLWNVFPAHGNDCELKQNRIR